MNSPASFVKSLLAQCCLGGICEWVVCPGARNMALLQVLAANGWNDAQAPVLVQPSSQPLLRPLSNRYSQWAITQNAVK